MANLIRHPIRVPRVEKPRSEGRFYLPTGRRLGFAEFGDPAGDPVLWFHGTPGGRRQFPLLGRRAAEKLNLRVVLVARPGTGLSDPHPYESVADWATDMAHVADALGAERLGVVGLSGGGPYALACGAVPSLAERVAAVAVLGGVVPSVGSDALATGAIALARRFAPVLHSLRRPLAESVNGLMMPLLPLAHFACQAYASVIPEGDRRVLKDPEMEGMFIDDLVLVAKGRFQGIIDDARLFGRDWGFRLGDVTVPVRWWHGDADNIVPLADAQAAIERLPDAELILRHEESHLGGFASADDVLAFLRSHL
ncbi:alpha/beta fold hydrolase [Mycobacterium sp. IDR2000157661]|uniref:alpha/beta fold hydrolase n=1 Tax=Mycobacterium sp. IDR2000157661 TaxID=2867005 RepID=UPI001EEC0061|nr:alpha/beta hydrolase [Mycobacterium sp. IDR2000157661]ULE34058.1 alpha/beta hydrolase [Mycobacterium sp. IDR2000157661]